MTTAPPPPPPPPASPPPPDGETEPEGHERRYAVGAVIGWAFLTLVALIAIEIAGAFAVMAVPNEADNAVVWIVGSVSWLFSLFTAILAIMFLARRKGLRARSRWMGVLIGSGVHLIVFGGLCVAFLAALNDIAFLLPLGPW